MGIRRCPLCHRTNEERAWQCHCGYEFGQTPEKAIELLLSQRRNLRINLFLLLAIDAAAVVALIAIILAGGTILVPGFGFGALAIQTGRVVHKMSITRESLRQMRAKQLPRARLVLRD